jgi:hypothetical protein
MWEFPGDAAPHWLAALLARADPLRTLDPVRHVFSHKAVTYLSTLYHTRARAPRWKRRGEKPGGRPGEGAAAWVAFGHLARYALPVAQQRIARLACSTWGG